MTFQVVFQPGAQRDLWAAAGWIEEQSKSPAKALRWVRGVRAKIETLKSNPTRCPVDADSEAYGEEVRVLLYGKRHGKYRILFAIRGETVHILTVRHSARQSLSDEYWQDDSVQRVTKPLIRHNHIISILSEPKTTNACSPREPQRGTSVWHTI